jgi:hypothetical protein
MQRREAALKITPDYVARFMGGLLHDQDELKSFSYRLYHGPNCVPSRCSCDPLRRRFRMDILNALLKLSLAARDGTNDDPLPRGGPSPLKRARPRHPGGRLSKYSPELAVRLGLLVTMGSHSIESALAVCGVCRRSLKRWRRRHELLEDLLYTLEDSRAAFPRHYLDPDLSPKKRRSAGARRSTYAA